MRGTALGLGIAGGIIGLIVWMLEALFGVILTSTHTHGGGEISGLAWLTLVASLAAIVGGGLAISKARTAAIILLVACVVGFIGSGLFWILSGILVALAALVAFLGRQPRTAKA